MCFMGSLDGRNGGSGQGVDGGGTERAIDTQSRGLYLLRGRERTVQVVRERVESERAEDE